EQSTDGNPVDRLVFSGLVLMGALVLISRGQSVVKLLSMNKPLVLFFVYAALSILWSDFPGVAFKRWIKALGDPIMALVILSDPDRSVAVKRFFAWTGFVLMPVSVLLAKYYPLLGLHFYRDGSKGIVGVATDKNMLGAICLISGLGAVWRILYA